MYSILKVDLKDIKANAKNPRVIRDDKLKSLIQSLKQFPEMLEARPLVCVTDTDKQLLVLGGNMRLKALQELKLKKVPVILADDWSEEQRQEFIVKDNLSYGDWNWEQLSLEWQTDTLQDWGLDLPEFMTVTEPEETTAKAKSKDMYIKLSFKTVQDLENAQVEVQEIVDRYKGTLSIGGGEL